MGASIKVGNLGQPIVWRSAGQRISEGLASLTEV